MSKGKVFITDYGFDSLEIEKSVLEKAGYEICAAQCKTADEVLKGAKDAEALLVQWAPVPEEVIRQLKKCKIIVRYGIGTDNVALTTAKEKGIPVCNVPDYCINEVADHAMAMALSLGRQLKTTEMQIKQGVWKIMPPKSLPPFREMTFATAGFGRIAREVLQRAKAFKFSLASYDPYVSDEKMEAAGVKKVDLDKLFQIADILSLHLPLNKETHHFVNKSRLLQMKKNAFLINTSRGELVDTQELADILGQGNIGGAGLDVFEQEPLPASHPLRECEPVILTSHAAWYSEKSGQVLQLKAAEETLRGLMNKPLMNRVA